MVIRRTLTRTITQTKIESAIIEMVDSTPKAKVLKPIIELGELSHSKAQRVLRKTNPKATVTNVTYSTSRYSMPMTDFMKVANKTLLKGEDL